MNSPDNDSDKIKIIQNIIGLTNTFDSLLEAKYLINKYVFTDSNKIRIKLPENKFLLMDIMIPKMDNSYEKYELNFLKIVVRLNKSSEVIGDTIHLTVYAMEKHTGFHFFIPENRKSGQFDSITQDEIIRYKILERTDGPLLLNWYWVSDTLKNKIFCCKKIH